MLSPYAVRMRGINPARLTGVKNATVGVEDEGSQLAALALAHASTHTERKSAVARYVLLVQEVKQLFLPLLPHSRMRA